MPAWIFGSEVEDMANSDQSILVGSLRTELANRERNLRVIQETIENDPESGIKLVEVRDLLVRRVADLREQISLGSERGEIKILA